MSEKPYIKHVYSESREGYSFNIYKLENENFLCKEIFKSVGILFDEEDKQDEQTKVK